MSNLSTEHLTKCILQKDKYKQTQIYLKELQLQNQTVYTYINEALYKILVTNTYPPTSKLYALRFFKDVFLSAQFQLIDGLHQNIMKQIIKTCQFDKQNSQKAKRGSTYFEQVQKRKKQNDTEKISYSFVLFSTQIVYVMGVWHALDENNEQTDYAVIYEKLLKSKVPFPSNDKQLKFFKPEQKQIFMKNYKQWVEKLPQIEQQSDEGQQKQNMNQKSKKSIKSRQKIPQPSQNVQKQKQKINLLSLKDQNKIIQPEKNNMIIQQGIKTQKTQNKINELRQKTQQKQKEINIMRLRIEQLIKKDKQNEAEIMELRNNLRITKQSALVESKSQMQSVKVRFTVLENKCLGLQNKLMLLQKQNSQLKMKLDEYEVLRQKMMNQNVQHKLLIKKSNLQKVETQQKYVKIIQQKNIQIRDRQGNIKRLQRQIDQLNAIKKSYKKIIEQDQASINRQVNNNKNNNQNIQNRYNNKNNNENNYNLTNEVNNKKIDELQKHIEQIVQYYTKQIIGLKSNISQLKQNNEQLQKTIIIINKQIINNNLIMQQKNIKISNLQQQIYIQNKNLCKSKQNNNNISPLNNNNNQNNKNNKLNINELNTNKQNKQNKNIIKQNNIQSHNYLIQLPLSIQHNQLPLQLNINDIKPQLNHYQPYINCNKQQINQNKHQIINNNKLQTINNKLQINYNGPELNKQKQLKRYNSMSDYLHSQDYYNSQINPFKNQLNIPLNTQSQSYKQNKSSFEDLQLLLKQNNKNKNKSLGKTQKSQQKVKQRRNRYSAGKTFHFSNSNSNNNNKQRIIKQQLQNQNKLSNINLFTNKNKQFNNNNNNYFKSDIHQQLNNYIKSQNKTSFCKKSSALLLQRKSYCQQSSCNKQSSYNKQNPIHTMIPFIDNYFTSKNNIPPQNHFIFKSLCLFPYMRQKQPLLVDKIIQVKLFSNSLNSKQIFILQVMNVSYTSIKIKAVSCHDQFKILGDKSRFIHSNSIVEYQIQTKNKDLNLRYPIISLIVSQDQGNKMKNSTYNIPLPLTLLEFTQIKDSIPQFYDFCSSKLKVLKSQTFNLNPKFLTLKECFPQLLFSHKNKCIRNEIKKKQLTWQGNFLHNFIQNIDTYCKMTQLGTQITLQFAFRDYDQISENYAKAMIQNLIFLLH